MKDDTVLLCGETYSRQILVLGKWLASSIVLHAGCVEPY